ncbi:Histidine kinase [Flavobacterium sp. 9AF]|uniref:ATP-binding protein n=1 Tax=Flavobacterium sp. 9AF TaxID=2653142 RepID=UPI0012F31B17|nr:ATP-binding protein [Flavobacterium sp. 9AF]VXB59403.1 Histidine kinase [Flavobacterium sp. 9AF]
MENEDITPSIEKKLIETQVLKDIVLESSSDCLKILDTEGRLQFMNFNGMCTMEIDDFSQIKHQYWWNLWGDENKTLVKNAVNKALTGEVTEFSAYCETAKGTPKWWHVTITPVALEKGDVYQLLSISKDITELKLSEAKIKNQNIILEDKVRYRTEELLQKNIELEKRNKELAMFNHIASHDLQEPLRKINFFSKLILENSDLDDKANIYLNRILDANQRMRNLIESLQKFSSAKDINQVLEDCNLNELINYTSEYCKEYHDSVNFKIEFHDLPTIKGPKVIITQLIINLIENAIKYRKENVPLQIKISSETLSQEQINFPTNPSIKTFYKIKIADNGIGFDNQYRYQIFEPFKKLHSKDEYAGTGMGLAICKTIMENINGWIEAESDIQEGSNFYLYFPKGN